ncbi:MAG TPA: ABC transporter substrate-binding protein [Planctomycetota bacterium]|jgi:NitT/TauT family transport system substrate-binding protein|nr:ABC transporter substrate-binding protein [Planctomycetota bacterium]
MKIKLLIAAVVILGGLFFLNRYFGQKKEYIAGVPASATPASGEVRQHFTVGFLPVTCHLTCPVTSWITQHSDAGSVFEAQKFTDFPSMKEALIARKIDATFMITPLAMKLAADGVPVKIVYLGHRDGSAIIVPVDSPMKEFTDLKGKIVAIPSRFSNQNLLMHRMMKKYGMTDGDITLKELPPPEHPAALAAKAIDAFIIGEPHAAKAEMDGFGRVLYQCGELWPGFISCGLVVRQEVIDQRRPLVEELVRGIAASGKWLDSDKDQGAQHRKDASIIVGSVFYNQKPALLNYVLTKDVNRVKYTGLKPPQDRFDEIMDLAVEMKVIPKHMKFEEYCDTSFAPDLETIVLPCDRLPEVEKYAAKQ